MIRWFIVNCIKSNWNYIVVDVSEMLGVYFKIVCNWICVGLLVIDVNCFFLINGVDLKVYLK